jgi:hypothetical protein
MDGMDPLPERLASALELLPPARRGPGVCLVCHTFIAPGTSACAVCRRQPRALSVIAPVSYSVGDGRLHRELRAYKDHPSESIRDLATISVAVLLDCYLTRHEQCLAAASGVTHFGVVTAVPSRTRRSDAVRGRLRAVVRECPAVAGRFSRLLVPSRTSSERHRWSPDRFRPVVALDGAAVLLVDDTWTTGASAQSAALALRRAGAARVALVVLGRHVSRDHADNPRRLAGLPRFDWSSCALHGASDTRRRGDQPGGALVPPEVRDANCAG